MSPTRPSLTDLDLTDDERSYLAMHARYASQRQDDFRYQDPDPARREELKVRWRLIADALHRGPITAFAELFDLPEGTVVQDANGQVWRVQKHQSIRPERAEETWLCPFSDEYSFSIKPDGSTYAQGDTPELPLRNTGLTSTRGA